MDELTLTEEQRRVYEAAAEVEAGGEAGTAQEIGQRAGVDPAAARAALAALVSDRVDLLRQLPGDAGTGPRYSVKGQPSPEA